ncbi:MAG: DUF2993 domain-containing protein [Microcystaceae cyanobacterium]
MWIRQSTDLISKVLSPAVKLWLRSQVEQVEQLQFKINGQDRQILRGYIPTVSLESSQAVYQGLHLGDIQLQGTNIRINIGQVLRGKPLKLLEPIWLKGEVYLTADDLQASLSSALLISGLNDLWQLIQDNLELDKTDKDCAIEWQSLQLDTAQFDLLGQLKIGDQSSIPLEIESGLTLINSHTLGLKPKQIKGLSPSSSAVLPETEIPIDLGKEVDLHALEVTSEGIFAAGQFVIRP